MEHEKVLKEVREARGKVKSFVSRNWIWFGVGLGLLIAVMAVVGS